MCRRGEGLFDFDGGFGTVTGMKRSRIEAGIFAACAALCLALACGCGRASEDRRDARDRNLRRAQAARDAEDLDAAIRWCEKALARRPDSPRAHRELALIYDHFKQDYVPALYHYRRYLELRPDAEDRADVEDMLAKCSRAFAAQIAAAPADQPVAVPARPEPPPPPRPSSPPIRSSKFPAGETRAGYEPRFPAWGARVRSKTVSRGDAKARRELDGVEKGRPPHAEAWTTNATRM